MADPEPPVVKLVLAAGQEPWTGVIYPTQVHRGARHPFSSLGDLLAAVADLLRWDVPPARTAEVRDLQGAHLSPEQKLTCVLRVLHGDVPLVDASRSAGASVQAVAEWRQAVVAASLLALGQAPDEPLRSRTGALVDGSRSPSTDHG